MPRSRKTSPPRVIQLVVDGLHPRILQREVAAGTAPNLAYLVAQGHAQWDMVSVFPTSTPPAVTSIMTGAAPDRHHIPGMYWWDRRSNEAVYYGDRIGLIGAHFGTFFENIVGGLNLRHLSPAAPTIFEQLEAVGVVTASINNICFRGPHSAPTTLPHFIRLIPGVRFSLQSVRGARHLRFGDFARSAPCHSRFFGEEGPFKQFGISDSCTLTSFLSLAEAGPLPPYTCLYFPDNDIHSHDHGPEGTGPSIRTVDAHLGRIFDVLGGRNRAIETTNFLLVADHAQMNVGTRQEAAIDLDELLGDFRRLPLGRPWAEEDIFVCPNGRFAQLYLHPKRPWLRRLLIERLRTESRIEHLLWRDGDSFHVHDATRAFSFRAGGNRTDRLGNTWRLQGDAGLLDLPSGRRRAESATYPDALTRIAEALRNPATGEIALTAAPGYEFAGNGEAIHLGGGSHGGLRREESLVPFIACGPQVAAAWTETGGLQPRRTTDVLDCTLALFGLRREVPHAA